MVGRGRKKRIEDGVVLLVGGSCRRVLVINHYTDANAKQCCS